jgi:predicted PurR-regulated permease PerM
MSRREEDRRHRLPPLSYYAKITLVVIAVSALVSAAWSVRNVLVLVLIAAVLGVGLDPAVRRFQRIGMSRGWSVTVIFLIALGALAGFLALVIPPLVREIQGLASSIPDYIDRLERDGGWLGDFVRENQLADKLRELVADLPSKISSSFGTIFGVTRSVASVIFNTLTIAILTIYFLLSLPELRSRLNDVVVDEREPILDEAVEKVGGYVSGNLVVSIIAGVATFFFCVAFGIPYAAALAMWVAIADLIPTIGATLGALVVIPVAFFSSPTDGWAAVVFYVGYQQIENYLIVPRVMKTSIDLSPAAVIVSVMIGGSLAGFAGALLALPVAAVIKVVIRHYWLTPRVAELEAAATSTAAEEEPL